MVFKTVYTFQIVNRFFYPLPRIQRQFRVFTVVCEFVQPVWGYNARANDTILVTWNSYQYMQPGVFFSQKLVF